jgi:hypothetical protein
LVVSQHWLQGIQKFQVQVREPVVDIATESPAIALESLREAIDKAPATHRDYLKEALGCYVGHHYRAAVLMTWSATMSRLHVAIADHHGGIASFEKANADRFVQSAAYRRVRRKDDLMYLRDRDFIELAEKAGLYNKSTRQLLIERLELRNRCGHPTGHSVGRGETVVFIESLCINIISGATLNWH